MKIIIVGASGKIGREIDRAVSDRHEVIRVEMKDVRDQDVTQNRREKGETR